MKYFRSTLLLLLALVALGALVWRDRAARLADDAPLLGAGVAQASRVRIASRDRGVELKRAGASPDSWTVLSWGAASTSKAPAPADPEDVRALLDSWAKARPARALEEKPSKLDQFGLGKNAPSLLIGEATITLGRATPINPLLFYALVRDPAVGGEPKLALLPRSLLLPLNRTRDEWRDRRLLAFEVAKIQRVEAVDGATRTILEKRGGWRFRRGAVDVPAEPAAAEGALSSLANLRAESFLPRASAPQAGALVVQLAEGGGRKLEARVGAQRATSSRLPDAARLERRAAGEFCALWRRPAREWRQKKLFDFLVTEPSRVFVAARGRRGTWLKAEGAWAREVLAGEPAPDAEVARRQSTSVEELLVKMSELEARDFVAASPASTSARAWNRVLEMRVGTASGEQKLEIARQNGRLLARVDSAARDDDAATLFVLDDEATARFESALGVLFPSK